MTNTSAMARPKDMAVSASADSVEVETRTWIAVAAGILGAFMAILDIQITNSSLKEILGTLSATQEEGSWISTAYLVAEIIVIPLTGFFCLVFGARTYMLANSGLFLLFSALCANAWSIPSMIIFRALQGFAGGALIPMALTLVLTQIPVSKRGLCLVLFGLASTLAPTLGPTIGGYLTELYGWPSIFYINWVPGLLLLAGIAYGLDHERPQLKQLLDADWLGVTCMAIGLGSLTLCLEEGNSHDWFESSFIVTCAALAFTGLSAWIVIGTVREKSFVNLRLYGQRNFLVAAIVSAVTGMGLYGSAFLLPVFLAQIPNYTPMQIGEIIMWMGLPQILMVPIIASLTSKVDNRILCSVGLALFGISCLMNTNLTASTGYDQLVVPQVIRALGQPLITLTISAFAVQGVKPGDMASASSLFNMSRNLGGSVGIALLATTLTNRAQIHSAYIGESISQYSVQTQSRLEQLTNAFVAGGSDPASAMRQAVKVVDEVVRRESYVIAYNDCFLIMGSMLLLSIFLVWFADPIKSVR